MQDLINVIKEVVEALETIAGDEPEDDAAVLAGKLNEELADFLEDYDPDSANIDDGDLDRMHEAICEGRRQDAIDILNELTGANLRSISAQRNLFPNRVPK